MKGFLTCKKGKIPKLVQVLIFGLQNEDKQQQQQQKNIDDFIIIKSTHWDTKTRPSAFKKSCVY